MQGVKFNSYKETHKNLYFFLCFSLRNENKLLGLRFFQLKIIYLPDQNQYFFVKYSVALLKLKII